MHSKVAPGSLAVNAKVADVPEDTVAGPEANVTSGPFASTNTCTRWLFVSATSTLPKPSIAIADGRSNSAVSQALRAELGQERARGGEPLDPMVVAVGDPHGALGIEGQVIGRGELPVLPARPGPPLAQEAPARVELLDALVRRVGDPDVAGAVDLDAMGRLELPVARAEAAPGGDEGPAGAELLDAVVARVHDVDVAGGVDRDPRGGIEHAVGGPEASPLREVGPVRVELLDPLVRAVGHVQVAARGDRDRRGVVQRPRRAAGSAPLGHVGAVHVELLDQVLRLVGDVDVARRVGGQAGRYVLDAGSRVLAPLELVGHRRGEPDDPIVAGVGHVDLARGRDEDALRRRELPGAERQREGPARRVLPHDAGRRRHPDVAGRVDRDARRPGRGPGGARDPEGRVGPDVAARRRVHRGAGDGHAGHAGHRPRGHQRAVGGVARDPVVAGIGHVDLATRVRDALGRGQLRGADRRQQRPGRVVLVHDAVGGRDDPGVAGAVGRDAVGAGRCPGDAGHTRGVVGADVAAARSVDHRAVQRHAADPGHGPRRVDRRDREPRDAAVAGVGDVELAAAAEREPFRRDHHPAAERGEQRARGVVLLDRARAHRDPGVAVAVGDDAGGAAHRARVLQHARGRVADDRVVPDDPDHVVGIEVDLEWATTSVAHEVPRGDPRTRRWRTSGRGRCS